jgi:hypothetical protein
MIKQFSKLLNNSSKYFGIIYRHKHLSKYNITRTISTYKMTSYKYPEVRRDASIVDDLHGIKVYNKFLSIF